MLRVIGAVAAAAFVSTASAVRHDHSSHTGAAGDTASFDVSALLTAARGVSPNVCALAARAVGNGSWGRSSDAPVTPLGASADLHGMLDSRNLPAVDVTRLMGALGSDDPCVRELSVRLIGTQNNSSVAPELLSRSTDTG